MGFEPDLFFGEIDLAPAGGVNHSSYNLLITCFVRYLTYTTSNVLRKPYCTHFTGETIKGKRIKPGPQPTSGKARIQPHIYLAPMSVSFLCPLQERARGRESTWETTEHDGGQTEESTMGICVGAD